MQCPGGLNQQAHAHQIVIGMPAQRRAAYFGQPVRGQFVKRFLAFANDRSDCRDDRCKMPAG
jgi:hypothetical protein